MSERAGAALLCYDGSPGARYAIERSGELLGGGAAIVLHCWLPPSRALLGGRALSDSHPLAPAAADFDSTAADHARQVAAEGASLATDAGFEAEPATEPTPDGVWRAILKAAEEHDAHLVVVGSHGRSAAKSLILGSVSRGVVNHAPGPVLVVPPPGGTRS